MSYCSNCLIVNAGTDMLLKSQTNGSQYELGLFNDVNKGDKSYQWQRMAFTSAKQAHKIALRHYFFSLYGVHYFSHYLLIYLHRKVFILQSTAKPGFALSVAFLLTDIETSYFWSCLFSIYTKSVYLLNALFILFYLILITTLLRLLSSLHRWGDWLQRSYN